MSKILVVDDSISVRKAVEKMLLPEGMEIFGAASVGTAREALLRSDFDLVLCDVYLPDGDAFDVMATLAGEAQSAAVAVMMTGNLTSALTERAEGAGFLNVLAKPFQSEELLKVVASLLDIEEEGDRDGGWLDQLPGSETKEPAEFEPQADPRQGLEASQDDESPDAGSEDVEAQVEEPSSRVAIEPDSNNQRPSVRWPTSAAVADAIDHVLALDGVRSGVLINRRGAVVYGAGAPSLGDLVCVSARLAGRTERVLRELDGASLETVVVEYGDGALLVERLEEGCLLSIDLKTRLAVARVRYKAQQLLPGLVGALTAEAA